jgi:uncharacterized membrane protein YbhN (UPF0104 family)
MAINRERALFAARICAWVVVGAVVIVFARRMNWDHVFSAFEAADLRLALIAALLGLPCTVLQGLRWSCLVSAVRKTPFATPVAALCVGQAASAFLPLRGGEAVRTELLARATGMGRAAALGTVALDHSVNGLVMFAFAGFLPLLLPVPRWLALLLWGGMAAAIAVVLVLLRLARKPSGGKGRLGQVISKVRSGLVALHNPAAVLASAAFSAAAWALEVGITMLALAAFRLPHDLPHAMGVLFGVNVAQAIPAPPASLGNFELGAGTALVAFGGSTEHAAAFAIGFHAIQLLPTLIAGGLLLPRFRLRLPQHA